MFRKEGKKREGKRKAGDETGEEGLEIHNRILKLLRTFLSDSLGTHWYNFSLVKFSLSDYRHKTAMKNTVLNLLSDR